ncbi:MAG: hypothetical protein QXV17_13495 [Candidatus Micrarchaeaceae archaeon]
MRHSINSLLKPYVDQVSKFLVPTHKLKELLDFFINYPINDEDNLDVLYKYTEIVNILQSLDLEKVSACFTPQECRAENDTILRLLTALYNFKETIDKQKVQSQPPQVLLETTQEVESQPIKPQVTTVTKPTNTQTTKVQPTKPINQPVKKSNTK